MRGGGGEGVCELWSSVGLSTRAMTLSSHVEGSRHFLKRNSFACLSCFSLSYFPSLSPTLKYIYK